MRATVLPFRREAFHASAANFVVTHVDQPSQAVAELARVTRTGGRVGATVWPQPQLPVHQLWDDIIEASGVERPPMPEIPPEENFPRTSSGLRDLVAGAGLLDVEVQVVHWGHRVDREEWWRGAADGIANIGYIVTSQSEATILRMKAAYDRLIQAYLDGEGMLRLPAAAVLAVGTAP